PPQAHPRSPHPALPMADRQSEPAARGDRVVVRARLLRAAAPRVLAPTRRGDGARGAPHLPDDPPDLRVCPERGQRRHRIPLPHAHRPTGRGRADRAPRGRGAQAGPRNRGAATSPPHRAPSCSRPIVPILLLPWLAPVPPGDRVAGTGTKWHEAAA